jgi:signal peptide peptidase SppA
LAKPQINQQEHYLNMEDTNISLLAQRLVNRKMLISPTAHQALIKQIESLLEQPNPPVFAGEVDIISEASNITEPGSTAIISINGILAKDVSPLEEMALGLVDVEWISDCLSECVEDPNISNIVLNFNSPGGETTGIEELGRKIANIDQHIKPVYGWTDKMATSAAYWLLSQTRFIGMIPSAEVAGIGVYSLVLDATKQMEQQGLSMFVASSGKYKMMGHEFRSLTDEEKKILQEDTEKQHEKFKDTILSKRPNVKAEDMEGLSYEGKEAIEKNLVDILFDSMDEFLIYINSSAVIESNNMKNLTKTKVATSAIKVEETPTTAAVKVEEVKIETVAETPVVETAVVTPVIETKAELPGVPGAEGEGSKCTEHPEPDEDDAGGESDNDEDNEDEMEECTCTACGSKYQKKKAAKEPEEQPEDPKKSEATPIVAKTMELSTEDWHAAFGIKKQAVSKEKFEWNEAVKNTFTGNPFSN